MGEEGLDYPASEVEETVQNRSGMNGVGCKTD